MKVGIIRGPNLSYYEMLFYKRLEDYNIFPTGVCSKDNRCDISNSKIPIKPLYRFKQIINVPLAWQIAQFFFPYNDYLLNFNIAVKEFDILHSADSFYPFSYQTALSSKPSVFTIWENIPFNNERFAYKKFKKVVYEKGDHFIAVTNRAKTALEMEGVDSNKISVIPAGIDTEMFKPQQKNKDLLKKYKIPKDAIIILFVGRLVWEKGILDLIYAFSKISKTNKQVYLIIAGSGKLKKKINSIIERLHLNNIIFLDFVPYHNIPLIYNLSDILCVPSCPKKIWQEQFGLVFIEAMACEKAVISTFSGSIPEVVKNKETGILVSPSSAYELVQALQELISKEKLRKKLGQEGRKRVLEYFDARIVAKKLAGIYNKVLGSYNNRKV